MLGQPASSHTVCRPSRRTSDLSSVYSGPVLSRVLIHSGLRSIGTWLLRTSSRSSLRPEGSTLGEEAGAGALVGASLMESTVLARGPRPPERRARSLGAVRGASGGVLRVRRGRAAVGGGRLRRAGGR